MQEDSFHLVDSRPTRQNRGGRRFQPNRFQQRREAERRQETQIERGIPRKQMQKRQQFAQFHRHDQRVRFRAGWACWQPDFRTTVHMGLCACSKWCTAPRWT